MRPLAMLDSDVAQEHRSSTRPFSLLLGEIPDLENRMPTGPVLSNRYQKPACFYQSCRPPIPLPRGE